jgi:hypothetical protein
MSQNDVTGTAESGKKIEEKLTDEAKAKVRTALSDKMKKSSAPARALIKLAKSNPANVKEEVELDEAKKKLQSFEKMMNTAIEKRKSNPQKHEIIAPVTDRSKTIRYTGDAERLGLRKEEVELDEGGMPSSVIAYKQKLANMSDKEFAEKHGNKSEKELRDMAARHGYGWDKATKTGSDHYVKRVASAAMKEETLEEGRPKKNPTPETTERDPRKHIQVEAGRAAAGNVVDFHHNDGTTSKITPGMGRRITSHLNGLKPADRQSAVNKMHDSAEGLKV